MDIRTACTGAQRYRLERPDEISGLDNQSVYQRSRLNVPSRRGALVKRRSSARNRATNPIAGRGVSQASRPAPSPSKSTTCSFVPIAGRNGLLSYARVRAIFVIMNRTVCANHNEKSARIGQQPPERILYQPAASNPAYWFRIVYGVTEEFTPKCRYKAGFFSFSHRLTMDRYGSWRITSVIYCVVIPG